MDINSISRIRNHLTSLHLESCAKNLVDFFQKHLSKLSLTPISIRPKNYNPALELAVAVATVALYALYFFKRKTSLPIERETSLPIERETSLPIERETSLPIERETSLPIERETSLPIERETSLSVFAMKHNLGLIGKDQTFKFSERIQLKNKFPLEIQAEDFYVPLEIHNGSFETQDAQGNPSALLLPSSLFKDKKEGDIIRFYYDNHLLELTLNQSKAIGKPFEQYLEEQRGLNQLKHNQTFYNKDADRPLFFLHELGKTLKKFTFSDLQNQENLDDLIFYTQDAETYGRYCQLDYSTQTAEQISKHESYEHYTHLPKEARVYTFCNLSFKKDEAPLQSWRYPKIHNIGVEEADIHFIRSQGLNDLDDLWILIPHKNAEIDNRWPEDLKRGIGLNGKTFYQEQRFENTDKLFDPKEGDHLSSYHYGQYCKLSWPKDHTIEIRKIYITSPVSLKERLQIIFIPIDKST